MVRVSGQLRGFVLNQLTPLNQITSAPVFSETHHLSQPPTGTDEKARECSAGEGSRGSLHWESRAKSLSPASDPTRVKLSGSMEGSTCWKASGDILRVW